jgi:hypothetical protein
MRATIAQPVTDGALIERMQKLRKILPAMAEETAAARREAARLRVENARLARRVAELEERARRRSDDGDPGA